MKLKQVRALLTALALVVGTALCVSTVTWAKSLNPEPVSIINEQGEIVESDIQSDRTLYFGSTQEQDITKSILEKLRTEKVIKKDKLTVDDVTISLKSELVFDEEKNEYVESEKDVKDVMTIKDDKITFSRTGFFLAEVSIKEEKSTVIFDVDEKVLAYADLNDWVVKNNTKNPDFSVDFDKTEIKDITYDDSEVKTGIDGEYVLTYTITDKEDKTFEKSVLVTVGDKKVVDELSEKGVWVASAKKTAGNTDKPVVKPEKPNKPDSNNGSNNSGNQDNNNGSNNQNNGNQDNNQHTHVWGEWQVKKAATCDKKGLEERFCTTCNKKEVRKTPALGHALTETIITEPTCGTAGSKEISCTREGCTYKDIVEIPATGNHKYGDWKVVTESTCETDGQKERTCSVCQHVDTEILVKLGHDFVDYKQDEIPTCTENGTEIGHCSRCDKEDVKIIEKLGHKYDDGAETKAPTCEEDGAMTYTCVRKGCRTQYDEPIAKLGHEFVDYTVKTEPTCTTEGTEEAKCTRCDKTDTRTLKPLGHAYDDGVVTTKPGCETEGVMTFTCTREGCTNSYTEPIKATGHTFGEWFYASEDDKPTCTEKGLQTRKCVNDNCTKTETQEVDALGHDLKEEIVKEPTCETAGSKKVTCTREGCPYEDIVEIPAIGHKWDDGVVTTAPTCTTDGVMTYTCLNDKSHTRTEVIPATGHDLKEEVVKQPTCTEKGEVKVSCTKCDFEEFKYTDALGHAMDNGVVTTQPTCTTDGVKTFTCTRNCGHTTTEVVKALGHAMDNGVVTKEPTCTSTGVKTYTCTRNCGHTTTETLPMLDHAFGDWTVIQNATCTLPEITEHKCVNCGKPEKNTGHALGHNRVDDYEKVWVGYYRCLKCGYQTEGLDQQDIFMHIRECKSNYESAKKQVDKLVGYHCDRCGAKNY